MSKIVFNPLSGKFDITEKDYVKIHYIAGEILSGHRAVIIDADGLVYYADSTNSAHKYKVVGITQGAASLGAIAFIQTFGELIEPSWTWTVGTPIWISTGGLLTQTTPIAGFALEIAIPITATKIFIQQKMPITLV